ncbi:DUF4258 domain-containing protein [Methylotenera sp.]|uniref:DUF4258 domain-containing protein n=1 Tax=Methylotenera sp. TaxID=2051956 RepID=UPI0027358C43|nr:DUF4258 domain-containing protein [Methylotenera sp.]MDP3308889.1 DUF4258 domain-containing protein [Methylotenera sp.]
MYSKRFLLEIRLSHHAKLRMVERSITDEIILDLVEAGMTQYKDEKRLWIYKAYTDRNDNLLCIAVVIESVLVIKTVMHHFELEKK